MPKSRREHRRAAPGNYLWNLLPDNEGVLQRWGSKFSVSPRNPMALLEHGGPGVEEIIELMRGTRTRGIERSVELFFAATMYTWAILGTDAHAKNYSLLHTEQGPLLAPLYDVATALPYPDSPRKVKLAMAYGKHYRDFEIEARHVLDDAARFGLDPQWAYDMARVISGGIADAYSQAAVDAELTGNDAAFAAIIIDKVAARTKALELELRKIGVPERAEARRAGSAQPRGDAGRFS
jgi:serine/threonine-protein kinase HipA